MNGTCALWDRSDDKMGTILNPRTQKEDPPEASQTSVPGPAGSAGGHNRHLLFWVFGPVEIMMFFSFFLGGVLRPIDPEVN